MKIKNNVKIKGRVCGLNETIKNKLIDIDPATIGHYTEFGFMHPDIKPIYGTGKIIGNAVTVRTPAQDSEAVYLGIDTAEEGDILVIERGNDKIHASVGEIVALTASMKKISAIIVDGPITDYEQIKLIGIPVYATGMTNLTTKFLGSGGEVNMDISCGGVVVHPGDIIIADVNGVFVLRDFEVDSLTEISLKDQEEEIGLRLDIKSGKSIDELFYN